MNTDDHDDLDPEYIDKRQEARESHGDFLRDEMRDRQWEDGFKRELDAKLAATTDEQLRSELEDAGVDFTTPAENPTPESIARVKWNRSADQYNQWDTLDDAEKRDLIARETPPPAERPTPITDALCKQYEHLFPNWLAGFFSSHARNLERQLAEVREQHKHTSGNLYDEQQAHGLTKGKLTECQLALAAERALADRLADDMRKIARNPGDCDETGFVSGHISRAALTAWKEARKQQND